MDFKKQIENLKINLPNNKYTIDDS